MGQVWRLGKPGGNPALECARGAAQGQPGISPMTPTLDTDLHTSEPECVTARRRGHRIGTQHAGLPGLHPSKEPASRSPRADPTLAPFPLSAPCVTGCSTQSFRRTADTPSLLH